MTAVKGAARTRNSRKIMGCHGFDREAQDVGVSAIMTTTITFPAARMGKNPRRIVIKCPGIAICESHLCPQ
jgi:hypothetical protein